MICHMATFGEMLKETMDAQNLKPIDVANTRNHDPS